LDRNTRLALLLSFAVMIGWMMYQSQFEPVPGATAPIQPPTESEVETPQSATLEPTGGIESSTPMADAQASPAARLGEKAAEAAPSMEVEERTLRFEKPLYVAEFTNRGAGLLSWELRGYDTGKAAGRQPILMTTVSEALEITLATPFTELGLGDLSNAVFEIENEDESGVAFRYRANGVTVRKSFLLDEDSYSFRMRLEVENASESEISPVFTVIWPATQNDSQDFESENISLLHNGSVERTPLAQLGSPGFFGSLFGGGNEGDPEFIGEIDWAGIDATYFLGVLLPDNPTRARVRVATTDARKSGAAMMSFPAVNLPVNQTTDQEFRAYLGPKEPDRLEAIGGETIRSIDRGYSWIQPLVVGFGWLLRALYSVIPNYGIAIILLTILVRVVTIPLTNKQMRSMERMREVQPKVKELQEKFADDRQKQSEEMMKLYRSEGVNPLGGCFPMILQLPVFIGLFYALRSSIELRQAPFMGWISDLSAPETLFTIPGIDIPIRVLPLAMGASMVLQQKLTPQPTVDPAQARMMMTIMPIMMTVLFYQFPSGLVLYWFVSNILAISHQLVIGRRMRQGSA
jgi:YidC/Oxa1 family membrane protein insertase